MEAYEKKLALIKQFVERYGRLPTEVDPDYLEMLNMSKYTVSEVPMYNPGKCGNCGSSKGDGRKYVDFGLEIPWYGTLFLCGFCVRDVAEELGAFDSLRNDIARVKEKDLHIEELQEQGSHLEEVVLGTFEGVKKYFDNLHAIEPDSPVDSPVSVEPDKDTPRGTDITQSESIVIEPKSKPVKSTASSRRADVPSLADLLNAKVD